MCTAVIQFSACCISSFANWHARDNIGRNQWQFLLTLAPYKYQAQDKAYSHMYFALHIFLNCNSVLSISFVDIEDLPRPIQKQLFDETLDRDVQKGITLS